MRYSSKSGFWAVAVLLSGAAAFGSACGGSGGSDRNPTAGAGATGVPGGGATGTAGGTVVVPGGGDTSSTAGTSSGTGGGSATCDSTMTCCKTAVCTCPYPAGDAANLTIADMEDGTAKFKTATVMTAAGYWDFSRDASMGTVVPTNTAGLMAAAPGANGTTKSLHVTGTNLTGWGAALAAELSNGCPFDASKYGGVSFWAKGTTSVVEGTNKLLFLVGMPEFIPVENGGFCADMATNPTCYARHRVLLDLASDWKQYTVVWKDLAAYAANGPDFNPNRIRDIVFNASGPLDATKPPISFDFYVDELKFVPIGTPSSLGGGAGGASGTAGAAAGGASAAGAAGAATAGAGGAAAGSGGTGGA